MSLCSLLGALSLRSRLLVGVLCPRACRRELVRLTKLWLPERKKYVDRAEEKDNTEPLTFAVPFIVRAFDNFGLALLVEALALVVVASAVELLLVVAAALSSSPLLSDLSRASINSLTRVNLSSPQVLFKNS